MYSVPRSPILKIVVAVVINLALIALCQKYWSMSDENLSQQYLQQQQRQQGGHLPPSPLHPYPNEHVPSPVRNPVELPKTLYSLEVPEGLELTHDIAVPRDAPAWTEADTASLNTAVGFDMMGELLKLDYSRTDDLKEEDAGRIDFALNSRAQRIYKSLWTYLYPLYTSLPGTAFEKEDIFVKKLARQRPDVEFLLRLEQRLYPWLHLKNRTSFSMYDSFEGKGIVICAGNGQFEYITSSIQAIRRLQPTLPIQVFYMGNNDLSVERKKYILEMTNDIETVDIYKILDDDWMRLGGWAIKAFAILASRFKEVILVDSDAYFLQDPGLLFEDPGYKLTGSLFFYDRTLFQDWTIGPDWMRSMLPIMSNFPASTRMFRGMSHHEQESGVVVINKGTRLQGLLAVCKMNSRWERDFYTYKRFYGDKESFWVGYEMVQEPFAFVKSYPGVIGEMREDPEKDVLKEGESRRQNLDVPSVCGTQLHLDYKERPLWWNAGLMRNKNSGDRRTLNFQYWMAGGGLQVHRERLVREKVMQRELLQDMGLSSMEEVPNESKDPEWIFWESCLFGNPAIKLDDNMLELTSWYLRVDKIGKEHEKKLNSREEVDVKAFDWLSI